MAVLVRAAEDETVTGLPVKAMGDEDMKQNVGSSSFS
jgi:hypothetical protein